MADKQTIRLPERFDFSFHKNFNAAYEPLLTDTQIKELELDFSQVLYLDSSALGMLVLLAKKLANTKVVLSIVGAQGTAKDIINMANLFKLYQIK
ncbi:STAS domain-containing protein [Rheinheimera baltica]|uniref:STAS domain-containing protein n=1 Tax=Rheinheimera baltica TaxID=67576 RepID=A0ABT9I427_9GAMM|nr:STAS domain-containing protein [Rheinheimera baltica]MDP5138147.1 STAS domain-containing protein [Rheinheimera baltica]